MAVGGLSTPARYNHQFLDPIGSNANPRLGYKLDLGAVRPYLRGLALAAGQMDSPS